MSNSSAPAWAVSWASGTVPTGRRGSCGSSTRRPCPKGTVAFVGKGVVFDSGGLSLKTAGGMETMKTDMSGAAAVIAAMSTLRDLDVKTRVIGYVPLVENMPSGAAMRPGDVLTMRNGKTVEVLNTDAEGRLILADALSLASEEGADAIIDLATLTGAVTTALGEKIAGLMGSDDAWIAQVREAAERAGERMWHLPLPDDYRRNLDSEIADLRNISTGGGAGTLDRGTVPEGVHRRRAVGASRHRRHRACVVRGRGDVEGWHRLRRAHARRTRVDIPKAEAVSARALGVLLLACLIVIVSRVRIVEAEGDTRRTAGRRTGQGGRRGRRRIRTSSRPRRTSSTSVPR